MLAGRSVDLGEICTREAPRVYNSPEPPAQLGIRVRVLSTAGPVSASAVMALA